jgi:two-component system CheB/CheR fusion protein
VRAQHGIDCRFECEEPVEIAGQGRAAELLRIAQEAVTNAVRHSGASEIVIALKPAEDGWKLEVRDNGSFSFEDGPRGGMGLQTMRDRADRIRASLCLAPPPAGPGTLVSCSFSAGGDHPTPEQAHMLIRSAGVDETRA